MNSNDASTNIEINNGIVNVNHTYYEKQLPSVISKVIYLLSNRLSAEDSTSNRPDVEIYEIDDKIRYNDLRKYKEIVKDYGAYGRIVDGIYQGLDEEKPNSKSKFLAYIKLLYQKVRGDLLNEHRNKPEMEIISQNSDAIIDRIINLLRDNFLASPNVNNIDRESVEICLVVIVCAAFIDCKILEKPAK